MTDINIDDDNVSMTSSTTGGTLRNQSNIGRSGEDSNRIINKNKEGGSLVDTNSYASNEVDESIESIVTDVERRLDFDNVTTSNTSFGRMNVSNRSADVVSRDNNKKLCVTFRDDDERREPNKSV